MNDNDTFEDLCFFFNFHEASSSYSFCTHEPSNIINASINRPYMCYFTITDFLLFIHQSLFILYTRSCISTHISVRAAVIIKLVPGVPVVEFVWWKFPITLREVGRQNRTDAREEQLEPREAASHHIHLSHIHRSPARDIRNTHCHTCARSADHQNIVSADDVKSLTSQKLITVHLIDRSFISQRLCVKN